MRDWEKLPGIELNDEGIPTITIEVTVEVAPRDDEDWDDEWYEEDPSDDQR